MPELEFSVHVSYAGVDRGDGTDPRPDSLALLRELRVLAALRDASAEWTDADEEAALLIAVSDDGGVLTLTADDTITRGLRVAELRERFATAGLTLWLDDPADGGEDALFGDVDTVLAEAAQESEALLEEEAVFDEDPDAGELLDEADLEELFAPTPVRVREFSHRGPVEARVRATLAAAEVDYAEVGEWSLYAFASSESTSVWPPAKAEGPVIVLNLPEDGDPWVEVTPPGVLANSGYFWPNAERDTRPVLDIDAITVPAAAETYRMLLAEGDGTRDELIALAERCALDVDAAHAALRAEALGGVEGADARIRAFLRAFRVPAPLIDAAMSDAGTSVLADARRFAPKRWLHTLGDILVGGLYETIPLTRRERPLARAVRAVRKNPALGLAIAVAELAVGLVLTAVLRGGWKALGIALIADATGDLAVLWARARRRSAR